MSWIKLIAVNVFVLMAMIGGLLLAPPLLGGLYGVFFVPDPYEAVRRVAMLPPYEGIDWAEQHYEDLIALEADYRDYIIWRTGDYESPTINVVDGVRHTSGVADSESQMWFFGGSTTWSVGVDDASTFPSIFARRSGIESRNYAEPAYIARQSLAFLSNRLITEATPMNDVHVVFYDGLNEVTVRCRAEVNGIETQREQFIDAALKAQTQDQKWSLRRTFAQVIDALEGLLGRVTRSSDAGTQSLFSCADNPDRARAVADELIETWRVARDLTEAQGGRFTAILQPVAYVGSPVIDYLGLDTPYDRVLTDQYAAVYPIIRVLGEASDLDFIDLSGVFDACGNCYVDFAHVAPSAHETLVEAMAEHLNVALE